jgi:hypothetical protein
MAISTNPRKGITYSNISSTIATYCSLIYLRANTYDLLMDWKTSLTAVAMSITKDNFE